MGYKYADVTVIHASREGDSIALEIMYEYQPGKSTIQRHVFGKEVFSFALREILYGNVNEIAFTEYTQKIQKEANLKVTIIYDDSNAEWWEFWKVGHFECNITEYEAERVKQFLRDKKKVVATQECRITSVTYDGSNYTIDYIVDQDDIRAKYQGNGYGLGDEFKEVIELYYSRNRLNDLIYYNSNISFTREFTEYNTGTYKSFAYCYMTPQQRTYALQLLEKGHTQLGKPIDLAASINVAGFGSVSPVYGVAPNFSNTLSPFIRGTIVSVIDGDTMFIKVSYSQNVRFYPNKNSQGEELVVGNTYEIRLAGCNTPEKHSTDPQIEQDRVKRNQEWLRAYNLPDTKIDIPFEIAEEASRFTTSMVSGKEVILDVETVDNGYGPGMDNYQRILGVLHILMGDSQTSINLNKTLLSTPSKKHTQYPLARASYWLDEGVMNSKFPVISWLELDPYWVTTRSKPVKENVEGLKQWLSEVLGEGRYIDRNGVIWNEKEEELYSADGKTRYTTSPYTHNLNPCLPTDYINQEAYEPLPTPYHLRIGDVTLIVPPLAINVTQISRSSQVHTLRNRNPVHVMSGNSDYQITIELFFHNVDAINGIPVKNPFSGHNTFLNELWPEPYYMNGLRALLAQFAKAPFLPIYNEFIEETYGIQNVALESIQISTVPGFPNTLAATLNLLKFDIDAYMPNVDDLGEAINWKLFRWYYQDALQPRYITIENPYTNKIERIIDPHHIYFPPLKGRMNNSLQFFIANEGDLQNRVNAIKRLADMTSVDNFIKKNSSDKTTIGQLTKEYEAITTALEQYNNFKNLYKKVGYNTLYKTNGYVGIPDEMAAHLTFNGMIDLAEKIVKGKSLSSMERLTVEFLDVVYNQTPQDGKRFFMDSDPYGAIKPWYFVVNNCPEVQSPDGSSLQPNMNGFGWIMLEVKSEINKSLFTSFGSQTVVTQNAVYAVIDPEDKLLIDAIITNASEGSKAIEIYTDEVNRIEKIADISEESIQMDPFEIPDLEVIAISGALSNILSRVNIQQLETPAIQYLGGQESSFRIAAQTKSKECIERLRELSTTVQRYAREYRMAINSGFLNVKNDIINLMGTSSIIIEQVEVGTVPGFPGVYNINIMCSSFDKTQKRRESLNQIQLMAPPKNGTKYNITDLQEFFTKNSVNEDKQFVIFDYKLKEQEIYPDLDLPTWKEFEEAIKYLDCGFKSIEEYNRIIGEFTDLNSARGKFLDPDFYVHCDWTNSVKLYQDLYNGEAKPMFLQDNAGVKVVDIMPNNESQKMDAPNVVVGPSFWEQDEAMREKLKQDIEQSSGSITEQSTTIIEQQVVPVDSSDAKQKKVRVGSPCIGKAKVNMDRVNQYYFDAKRAKDRDKMKFQWLCAQTPTEDELIRWGMNPRDPNVFRNPSHAEIINELERQVDEFFIFPEGVDSAEDYTYGDTISVRYITKAKVVGVFKAIMDRESMGWNQFLPYDATINGIKYGPKGKVCPMIPVSRGGNITMTGDGYLAVGLCQFAPGTAGFAPDLATARRIAWDWRYNMRVALATFAYQYNKMLNSRVSTRSDYPLDHAIAAYHMPSQADITGNNKGATYYRAIKETFDQKYSHSHQRYASPTMSQVQFPSTSIYSFSYTYDTVLLSKPNLNSARTVDISKNKYPNFFKYLESFKSGVDVYIYKMPGAEDVYQNSDTVLNQIVTSIDDFIARGNKFDKDKYVFAISKLNNEKGKSPDIKVEMKSMTEMNRTRDRLGTQTESEDEFLPDATIVPAEAAYKQFNDAIQFDMRGRLVRAFPTFQMFIVDEGRWTFWYKLWDNLYGYNAIQSIDVIRDRKIAADTAIITMTNVYNNLTTKSSRFEDTDWSFSFWNMFTGGWEAFKDGWQKIFNIADDEIVAARAEKLDTMILKPGARIHLRMGYGSNADALPIVFNGTIAEMDAQEVITIIAQGDGIELCNKLHAKPNDTSSSKLFNRAEPREFICSILSSRGKWTKDILNSWSDGLMFRGHPLGIVHFGQDGIVPPALKKIRLFRTGNDDYGEVGFNVYSANGNEMFSQWACHGYADHYYDTEGKRVTWGRPPKAQKEPNINVFIYDKTLWDVVNIMAMAVPDYIVAVHPFELRSTLFYGKPTFGLAWKYDYMFKYNKNTQELERIITHEFRKPYSQFHYFQSFSDIVSNKIKATEAGMYTNVVVAYGGNKELTTPLIRVDDDLYPEKQKTTIKTADLEAGLGHNLKWFGFDFWTSQQYAQTVGANVLRDYMKDMYDGELVVLGYPSIKPYDRFYLEDNYSDMQGTAGVKRVIHHMSFETGFITSITPDCIAIVDDMQQISQSVWAVNAVSGVLGTALVLSMSKSILRGIVSGAFGRAFARKGAETTAKAVGGIVGKLIPNPSDPVNIKLVAEISDAIRAGKPLQVPSIIAKSGKTNSKVVDFIRTVVTSIDDAAKAAKAVDNAADAVKIAKSVTIGAKVIKGAVGLVNLLAGPIGWILLDIGMTIVANGLVETYRRYLRNRQAVVLLPLKYRGKHFTAGINGHKGAVYGDPPGNWDRFFTDSWLMKTLNSLLFEPGTNPALRSRPTKPDDWVN